MHLSSLLLLALVPGLATCTRSRDTVTLTGAGATFPYPLYSKWISAYERLEPGVRINYQSIGSGGGIRQITQRTVDFGATDMAMDDAALAKAPGALVHIPTVLGAVVVTYNLPDNPKDLKLTPELLAAIFLGELTRWSDPRLAALNPEVSLPDTPVGVVHRSDGSGTTAVFTQYLARISAKWREQVSEGIAVSWPVGLGAKGNEGVTGQVRTTPGAIGYVELAYARQNDMPVAAIMNRDGRFVTPAIPSISAAAAGAADAMPEDLRLSVVNAAGVEAYPIASFTYILAYEEMPEPHEATALARFLWWAIHDGQTYAEALDYAPLPPEVVSKVETRLRGLRSGGKAVLPAQ